LQVKVAIPKGPLVGSLFLVFSITWGMAVAKLTNITLAELVRSSMLIAYGRTVQSSPHAAKTGAGMVLFEPSSILKGKSLVRGNRLALCNTPDDIESYNLREIGGSYLVFARKSGDCFLPIHGLRSVVVVEKDQAATGNIKDEPEEQPIVALLGTVRKLADAQR
jgi:hypothetical protein